MVQSVYGPVITRRDLIRGIAVTGAGLVLLPACSSSTSNKGSPTPAAGGVLRVAEAGVAVTEGLDPAITSVAHTQSFLWYDQLTWLPPDMVVRPNLAKSWTSNSDQTEWTFFLREGVKFHDGKPLTAEDVVYTYKRMLDPKLGSTHALVMSALDPNRIVAKDDLTVVFGLKFPMYDVPDQAAAPFVSIVQAGASTDDLAKQPMGTGAFLFKEYVPGERSVGVRNPDYWMKGFPTLDEVQILWEADVTTKVNGMKTGRFEIASDLSPIDAKTLEGTDGVTVQSVESGRWISFAMNASMPPFDDNRVRTALKLTQDRQTMLDRSLLGKGSIANDQPIPPISPIWGNVAVSNRDIDQAKSLLAEAGYPNGLDIDLPTTEIFPGATNLAVLLKEEAADAGFNLNVQKLDVDTYVDRVFPGRPSPEPFFQEFYNLRPGSALLSMVLRAKGPWNVEGWDNPEFEKALTAAQKETDPQLLVEKYAEVERIVAEDGPHAIPVFHNINEGVSTRVLNYTTHPMSFVREYRTIAVTA